MDKLQVMKHRREALNGEHWTEKAWKKEYFLQIYGNFIENSQFISILLTQLHRQSLNKNNGNETEIANTREICETQINREREIERENPKNYESNINQGYFVVVDNIHIYIWLHLTLLLTNILELKTFIGTNNRCNVRMCHNNGIWLGKLDGIHRNWERENENVCVLESENCCSYGRYVASICNPTVHRNAFLLIWCCFMCAR